MSKIFPSQNPVFAPFSETVKSQLDREAGLSFRATIGVAPVGAEELSWDTIEDEDGYRSRYEFFIIPDEKVTQVATYSSDSMSLAGLLNWLDSGDEFSVVEFSMSFGNGDFMAYGWTRATEAAADIRKFLVGGK